MKVELFPFQRHAVSELRKYAASALNSYRLFKIPQVISLQAPTGAGKTIIMAALVEEILYGNSEFTEQPNAIFVWLSDSPALNEQSKQKFELKAEKIRLGQLITIEDESFDMEMLEDGHVYFLNTQKLGKAGNLGKHSDNRQYTIWETIQNTAREKADRLYFIIDEAHRGMQGREAGKATSIMQRFLKGSKEHGLDPMPVVIGVSATAKRFNALVGDTTSTLNRCIIQPADVIASGLLKDRILISHPEDPNQSSEMAVLQAAADEWNLKCQHWSLYCTQMHYAQVNPVFVVQVQPGTGKKVSDTNLDDVLAAIEDRLGIRFNEHEVVHTFGSTGTLRINGLNVHHAEPSDITDDKRIRVVLFKENLSTGWDCPRAETMMSFRHAEDDTYIAQLLGRMVRTPLQRHIKIDDYLNDVRLFLPHFNKENVGKVIDEFKNSEGGEIPTFIDSETLEHPVYVPWTVHPARPRTVQQVPGQIGMDEIFTPVLTPTLDLQIFGMEEPQQEQPPLQEVHPQQGPTPTAPIPQKAAAKPIVAAKQLKMPNVTLDRAEITKFINESGLLTYSVRPIQRTKYLPSLLNLASLLTRYGIYSKAKAEVEADIVGMIRAYIEELHSSGAYDELATKVLTFKLSVRIFDVFGEVLGGGVLQDLITASESDLDRQVRAADARLGGYGFDRLYGKAYATDDDYFDYKVDCILFAANDDCIAKLSKYAEKKFHALNDDYRKYIVGRSETCRSEYSAIVADGDTVSKHNLTLPEVIQARVETGGKEYYDHLFADDNGISVCKLNQWEDGVLQEEARRSDYVCWIRNMSRASWALCLPYQMGNETKAMYPDFLIVRSDPNTNAGYVVDVLEPHSPDFDDNLAKAKALAKYAEDEPQIGRVELIRQRTDTAGKKRFLRLNMAKGMVREKVLHAMSSEELNHIFETDGYFM